MAASRLTPRKSWVAAILATTSIATTACYVVVDDRNKTNKVPSASDQVRRNGQAPSPDGDLRCARSECQTLPVTVHYMLADVMPSSGKAVVEAFDNPRFLGAPVATAEITGFYAQKPGYRRSTELRLPQGSYFFRAYVDSGEGTPAPYTFQNLNLITEKPMGVFGALSDVEAFRVESFQSTSNAPLNIYLNHMFRKSELEGPSGANVRVRLSLGESTIIARDRLVRFELRPDADLATHPQSVHEMPTERLLVEGGKGEADFLMTNLKEGNYIMFAFLDANGNGYHDQGEPSKLHGRYGEPLFIKVSANRTESIDIKLEGALDAQEPVQPSPVAQPPVAPQPVQPVVPAPIDPPVDPF